MADKHHKPSPASSEPKVVGAIAEFSDAHAVLDAAKRVKEAGYTKWDVHSPFPLHGIDDIMQRPTVLPWLCAGGACAGLATALLLQWWTNAVNYPLVVSGKQPFAFPATMPIDFELTVLFTAFAAFFSVILLSGLPKLYNPILRNKRFREGATDDRIFISIAADDPKFSPVKTTDFLHTLQPTAVEQITAVPESSAVPGVLQLVAVIALVLACIPPIMIVRKRNMLVDVPRLHPVIDMDFQPKFKAQKVNEFFADTRADRSVVAGTVARGFLPTGLHYDEGLDPSTGADWLLNTAYQPAGEDAPAEAEKPAEEAAPAGDGAAPAGEVDNTPYAAGFPAEVLAMLKADPEGLMKRGQQRFNIYCSTCHGLAGEGDGLVSRRALEVQDLSFGRQNAWVKPLSLHDAPIQAQPDGKLFRTISYGIRKMPGYSAQITTSDRWAIVLYIRALQRSRNASPEDVPQDQQSKLQAAR